MLIRTIQSFVIFAGLSFAGGSPGRDYWHKSRKAMMQLRGPSNNRRTASTGRIANSAPG